MSKYDRYDSVETLGVISIIMQDWIKGRVIFENAYGYIKLCLHNDTI